MQVGQHLGGALHSPGMRRPAPARQVQGSSAASISSQCSQAASLVGRRWGTGPPQLSGTHHRGCQHPDRRLRVAWQEHVQSYDAEDVRRVECSPASRPLVILPGFGNCTNDYTAPYGDAEAGLAGLLKARGYDVSVVQLERSDWLKVARNLFTVKFWSSELTTHPGYTWYLEKVHEAVQAAREATGSEQVDLIGHSAGGWLGRAYIADATYNTQQAAANEEPNPAIASLLTLGSPHRPPPPGKGRDMTGGALSWLHKQYPGAYFREHGVRYVCVAGRAVRGRRTAKRTSISRYAHDAYWQVMGEGHGVEGDAVVPCQAAVLPGATNIVLDGVFHSMANFQSLSKKKQQQQAAAQAARRRPRVWYGSDAVLDCWLATLSEDEESSSCSSSLSSLSSSSSMSLDDDGCSPLASLDGGLAGGWSQGVILPSTGSSISSTRLGSSEPVATATAPAKLTAAAAPAGAPSKRPLSMR